VFDGRNHGIGAEGPDVFVMTYPFHGRSCWQFMWLAQQAGHVGRRERRRRGGRVNGGGRTGVRQGLVRRVGVGESCRRGAWRGAWEAAAPTLSEGLQHHTHVETGHARLEVRWAEGGHLRRPHTHTNVEGVVKTRR